ncbi:hypothetical protein B0H11DRAFT_2377177 [Mycena galericulata]|nr:hypothetical protein B0H11DRAFT_2377177 [Mycena galericulata]
MANMNITAMAQMRTCLPATSRRRRKYSANITISAASLAHAYRCLDYVWDNEGPSGFEIRSIHTAGERIDWAGDSVEEVCKKEEIERLWTEIDGGGDLTMWLITSMNHSEMIIWQSSSTIKSGNRLSTTVSFKVSAGGKTRVDWEEDPPDRDRKYINSIEMAVLSLVTVSHNGRQWMICFLSYGHEATTMHQPETKRLYEIMHRIYFQVPGDIPTYAEGDWRPPPLQGVRPSATNVGAMQR